MSYTQYSVINHDVEEYEKECMRKSWWCWNNSPAYLLMIGEFCNHILEAIINSFNLVNLFNLNSIYWSKDSVHAIVGPVIETAARALGKHIPKWRSPFAPAWKWQPTLSDPQVPPAQLWEEKGACLPGPTWAQTLQDRLDAKSGVQHVVEKAEEPEIKMPTSTGS